MIPAFCPSLDRACQLHFLLESVQRNAPGVFAFEPLVKASAPEYMAGYLTLSQRFPDVKIFLEDLTDFENGFKDFLRRHAGKAVALFTDDCVFYDRLSMPPNFFEVSDVWCVSLRLGLNTTLQYYATGEQQAPLGRQEAFNVGGGFVGWDWKNRPVHQNYGYFISWDACIYRADDLLALAESIQFKNPREFEGILAGNEEIRKNIPRRCMVAPAKSKVFVNTVNCVQQPGPPAGLLVSHSPAELNEKYLSGKVIDFDSLDLRNIIGCHHELQFGFKDY